VQQPSVVTRRRFQLVLIKPSHYDDDGYVIRWWRAMTPSNSLAAVYGIAADCAERRVLGPDVDIDIEVIDETNTRIDIPALLSRYRRHDDFGCVALIGVQSNQYPRALDIARPFRAAGIAVAIGGFHVSGCLSMLDGGAVDLDVCHDMGVAIFAGEAEGRLESVIADVAAGRLAPIYNYMKDLPGMAGMPVPFLPKRYIVCLCQLEANADRITGLRLAMKITRRLFEAHVKCTMKCWLRSIGEPACSDPTSLYAEWIHNKNVTYRARSVERLMRETPPEKYVIAIKLENIRSAKWQFAFDVEAHTSVS